MSLLDVPSQVLALLCGVFAGGFLFLGSCLIRAFFPKPGPPLRPLKVRPRIGESLKGPREVSLPSQPILWQSERFYSHPTLTGCNGPLIKLSDGHYQMKLGGIALLVSDSYGQTCEQSEAGSEAPASLRPKFEERALSRL